MYRHALVLILVVACRKQPAASTAPTASEPAAETPTQYPVPPPMNGATMDAACYQQCMEVASYDPNGCWFNCNVWPPVADPQGCYTACMDETEDDEYCDGECECGGGCY
jgi:hypothetical protein